MNESAIAFFFFSTIFMVIAMINLSKKISAQDKALKHFARIFGYEITTYLHLDPTFSQNYGNDLTPVTMRMHNDKMKEISSSVEGRFAAIASHLKIRFQRETTQATERIVAKKL